MPPADTPNRASAPEALLHLLLAEHSDLLALQAGTEYRFQLTRRWRFDVAYPAYKVAVEVEGVNYDMAHPTRHQRPQGYADDCAKYNAALLAGWLVVRFTQYQLLETPAYCIATIREALTQRGALPRPTDGP
jgi:hypothetical protein